MAVSRYIGWDMGGAHLKIARLDAGGTILDVQQYATPLWQGLDCLRTRLNAIRAGIPDSPPAHGVTMTGELVDLFRHRQQGVVALLSEFCRVFDRKDVRVYAGPAGLLSVADAKSQYRQVASANWHATADFVAGRLVDGVLVDVGSSTTDIVPFQDGILCNRGCTDRQRLRYDELLYSGIVRTPVMAVVSRVPFAGEWQSIAAEQFATMADVYRITGELDESSDLLPAADGGGKQALDSIRRLARMVGSDIEDGLPNEVYLDLAHYIAEAHIHTLARSLQRVISANQDAAGIHLVGAGAGRFLVARLARRLNYQYTDFARLISTINNQQGRAADCAAAVSVAQLTRLSDDRQTD